MGVLTLVSAFMAIICMIQGVYGRDEFGIFVEFENACDTSVRIWLNSDQAAGDVGPGSVAAFPICTDPDCTSVWGLPKAFSYQYGVQTVEDEPCTLEGGKGEITVSATSPVRVYGFHRISCDGCTGRATEMNVPKQAPEEEEDDDFEEEQQQQSPAALLPAPGVQDKPSSPPPPPARLGPQSSSVPPMDAIAEQVEDEDRGITLMPPPPAQNDEASSSGSEKGEDQGEKEEESVYIPAGGDLFAFASSSHRDVYASIAVLLAIISL
ncbi:hypothetical protein M9435_001042 [Picochlorum sp. BPE23]|nr:hypothetical protein M9435_001042 [Picochlorum sp. BPE23]